MNTMIKQGAKIIGGVALLCLGSWLVYEAGCQKGVTTSAWLVKNYEPEAYLRLTRIITNHNKN